MVKYGSKVLHKSGDFWITPPQEGTHMSYANRRVSNPVDCRIGLTIFGSSTAPLLLLVSTRGVALQPQGPTPHRRVPD